MEDMNENIGLPEEQSEEQQDNRGQWFVVQTLSGNENKVRDTIQRQINLGDHLKVYEAFIPMETVKEYRNGKKPIDTKRKVFPGYVFVRMDLYEEDGSINEAAWYFVRGVQGVMGFPGGGNRPIPLTDREIEELRRNPEDEAQNSIEKCIYEVGDRVQIKEDAFEGFEGTVQEVDRERGRLIISVSVFGRSTPVELGFWQVDRLS